MRLVKKLIRYIEAHIQADKFLNSRNLNPALLREFIEFMKDTQEQCLNCLYEYAGWDDNTKFIIKDISVYENEHHRISCFEIEVSMKYGDFKISGDWMEDDSIRLDIKNVSINTMIYQKFKTFKPNERINSIYRDILMELINYYIPMYWEQRKNCNYAIV